MHGCCQFRLNGQRGWNERCATSEARKYGSGVLAIKLGIGDAQAQVRPKQTTGFTKAVLHHDGSRDGLGIANFAHTCNAACAIQVVLKRQSKWQIDGHAVAQHVRDAARILGAVAHTGLNPSERRRRQIATGDLRCKLRDAAANEPASL